MFFLKVKIIRAHSNLYLFLRILMIYLEVNHMLLSLWILVNKSAGLTFFYSFFKRWNRNNKARRINHNLIRKFITCYLAYLIKTIKHNLLYINFEINLFFSSIYIKFILAFKLEIRCSLCWKLN